MHLPILHPLLRDFGVDPSFGRVGLPGTRPNFVAVCHFEDGPSTPTPRESQANLRRDLRSDGCKRMLVQQTKAGGDCSCHPGLQQRCRSNRLCMIVTKQIQERVRSSNDNEIGLGCRLSGGARKNVGSLFGVPGLTTLRPPD